LDENKKEVKITFESIYEVLREEKKVEDLIRLDDNFFSDVSEYLSEKQKSALLDDEQTQKQISNIKRMITEILERRESKIIKLAMHSARMKTNFIDKSKLLEQELAMFYDVNKVIRQYHTDVLDKILKALYEKRINNEEVKSSNDIRKKYDDNIITDDEITINEEKKETKDLKSTQNSIDLEQDKRRVVFTKQVSKFVGENMEIFGPYEKEQSVSLPTKIAKILVDRNQAVFLEEKEQLM